MLPKTFDEADVSTTAKSRSGATSIIVIIYFNTSLHNYALYFVCFFNLKGAKSALLDFRENKGYTFMLWCV